MQKSNLFALMLIVISTHLIWEELKHNYNWSNLYRTNLKSNGLIHFAMYAPIKGTTFGSFEWQKISSCFSSFQQEVRSIFFIDKFVWAAVVIKNEAAQQHSTSKGILSRSYSKEHMGYKSTTLIHQRDLPFASSK